MIIETTIWSKDPYTITVQQKNDGTMKIVERTIDKTISLPTEAVSSVVESKEIKKPVSGLVVDVSGLEWLKKVEKIKGVMVENGLKAEEFKIQKTTVRKESVHSPDNFIVSIEVGSDVIYEQNGKFSVKRIILALD